VRPAQPVKEQKGGVKGLVITPVRCLDYHDSAGSDPGLPDMLLSLLGPQRPGDVAAMALIS